MNKPKNIKKNIRGVSAHIPAPSPSWRRVLLAASENGTKLSIFTLYDTFFVLL